VLTPLDDYPIHQTSLPIAHTASSDANHYDRFWCNGYSEDWYFAAGLAVYPNRGIIDAAFAVVYEGVQRSVFASGRIPLDRRETRVGPLSIDVVEPLRVMRVRADAADLGIDADVTFTNRTVALEEPRQILTSGTRTTLDSTRMTQWGTWTGRIVTAEGSIEVDHCSGTKDRSWGVRPVGVQPPVAPDGTPPQVCFLWAPLNFADRCTHFLCFERADGSRIVGSQAILDVIGPGDPVYGPEAAARIAHLAGTAYDIRLAPGLRRSEAARLRMLHPGAGGEEVIDLEPLLTFRMRGLGYMHPEWGHGTWHGELAVGAEVHPVGELDDTSPWNIHVQQVVRARWGDRTGLGVLEQLIVGEHAPTGLTGIFDGAGGAARASD